MGFMQNKMYWVNKYFSRYISCVEEGSSTNQQTQFNLLNYYSTNLFKSSAIQDSTEHLSGFAKG